MLHVIVTGGLGAGKTNLIDRLNAKDEYIIGSPATTMKRRLAKCIARTYNTDGTDFGWQHYFEAMLDRREKEKYRGILQGYGEYFSNLDGFFWIRRTMEEVQQDIDTARLSGREKLGTVYDSVRRPSEIIGIREVFPDAIRIHLNVSRERQLDYLLNHLGYEYEKAVATLAHSSEHWLDESDAAHDNLTGAELVIDADYGDEYVWRQFNKAVQGG